MTGLDCLGADVVGAFDIAAKQRQMNTLKQVTVSIARAMVKNAQRVVMDTLRNAEGSVFQRALPGITTLKKTQGHLQWHADMLAAFADPTAMYPHADDLKKWTMQAFIDANAVEEGRGAQEQVWQDMWTEIGEELMKLPSTVARAVAAIPGAIVEGVTGIPMWAWTIGGITVLGLLGFAIYKIVRGASPTVLRIAEKRLSGGSR